MIKKPNSIQRFIHRFVMLRPVTAFFAPRMHRLDGMLLKLTNDRHTISDLLGWCIVQLKTTGAKTGRLHTSPLIGIMDGEKILGASVLGVSITGLKCLKKNLNAISTWRRFGKYLARNRREGREILAAVSYCQATKIQEAAPHISISKPVK